MQVLAPISTSSPMTTLPSCSIFSQRPWSGAKPKPSAPITAPPWTMPRAPMRQASASIARGLSIVPSPTSTPAPTCACAEMVAPAAMRAPAPTKAIGPTLAEGWMCAPDSTTALAWMPTAAAALVCFAHHCVRRANAR